MELNGLHLLLTYQCTFECDHCFVWGSPWQSGTMTLDNVQGILHQAQINRIDWIYFEGGEPFLYYPLLRKSVEMAAEMGFQVGIVSNAYWAVSPADAEEALRPFAGLVQDFSISSDLYHYSEKLSRQARNARDAAEELNIPVGIISIAQSEELGASPSTGQIPPGESKVKYRGRAAVNLTSGAETALWREFRECPDEDLRQPGRLHVDPLGYVHICQGIALGNLYHTPLMDIIERYDPDTHPITAPLLNGGPAQLSIQYGVEPQESYADACHLCYHTRLELRERFADILTPDHMYAVVEG